MVFLGEERGEEALVTELGDEAHEDEVRYVGAAQLEADLARVVVAWPRVAHALRLRGEEAHERRGRDDRRDERHEDADAEYLLGEVAAREAEAGDYEGDLAAGHHAGANPEPAQDVEPAEHRRAQIGIQ